MKSEPAAAVEPRTRRRPGLRVLGTVIISTVSLGVLVWVAPPSQVIDTISDMNPLWVLGAFGLELASCLSYIVVFRRFFPEPSPPVSRRVAWIAMGAGAVLPGGNFSSAATTGWLLRKQGISPRRLIERCGELLCFLILFGWQRLFHPHWRMLGAAGFLLLDMAALWAVCRATGHPLGVLALSLAYFIGYLASMLPVPAGLGVLDSGLAGALVLYGFSPAASVGAVLVYHAIAIWIPGLGGLVAWLPTRRQRLAEAAGLSLAEPAPAG